MSGEPPKSAALEALTKVKKAEEEASRIIEEARDKTSVRIIKEATQAGEKIGQDLLARAKETAAAREKSILAEAEKEAVGIRAEGEAEISLLRQKAASSMSEAVEKISRKVKKYLAGGTE
jgi:V/A-type H+-transporting ATPase subunit G/H